MAVPDNDVVRKESGVVPRIVNSEKALSANLYAVDQGYFFLIIQDARDGLYSG